MNSLGEWQEANNSYLAVALGWLRQRLDRLATAEADTGASAHPAAAAPPAVVPAVVRRRSWLSHRVEESAKPITAPKAPPAHPTSIDTTARPAELAEAETAEHPPALITLARRLGLSEFERNVLLLCIAMELDTGIGTLCGRAQHDSSKPYPTFALALALFDEPAWEVMSPERPLRFWRLIEINQPGAQPLVTSALKADERVVNYVKGVNYLDDRLAPLLMPLQPDSPALPTSQQTVADAIAARLRASAGARRLPVFQLIGNDSASKMMVAQRAVTTLGLTLYRLSADVIPLSTNDHEAFLRLWERETALLPVGLYLDASQADRSTAQAGAAVRLITRGTSVVIMDMREPWPDLGREVAAFDVAKPTPSEQRAIWLEALAEAGDTAAAVAARPSGHFNFNASTIREAAAAALTASMSDRTRLPDTLWRVCVSRARPALDQLAQVIEPKAAWNDIELPDAEKSLLRQIADQVERRSVVYDDWGFRDRMNRGLGISVLFAGDSGTGKTMAAEAIAKELGLLLYRIDLSAVVSKYIGETEKNLRRLFDAAEDGGAILFFDEADALFGKRSEVKDSHDRYANIEINYLLQRMEAYRSLAVLATNTKSSLDPAFMRRLRFVVNFPFPGPAQRLAIWQKVFPSQTRTAPLDYQRLARLNLTGGSILNIALNAAFIAAQSGTHVTMQHVLTSARAEFRKLEKPISEAEFRLPESSGGSA